MTAHDTHHMVDGCDALLRQLDRLADSGKLRRLASVFARFITTIGNASPALIVACAVLSEMEGRGNSCLALADLVDPGGAGADAMGEPANPAVLLASSTASNASGMAADPFDPAVALALREAAGSLPTTCAGWRQSLSAHGQVWTVAGGADLHQPLVLDGDRLYLRRYWRDERTVANAIGARVATPRMVDAAQVRLWLDRLFAAQQPPDAASPDWQKIACAIAVRSAFSIITGGPGTGKTYTVARLLALQFALAPDPARLRIVLAAPTGKAAARLKQSIDAALGALTAETAQAFGDLSLTKLTARMGGARTLHSLLGARPDTRGFRHHAGHPLDLDVLIVDEASMVHLEMMAALLEALPPRATLILLGDKDQLASVEAGSVLGDLCLGAETGAYAQTTADYVAASSGQIVPGALRLASPASAPVAAVATGADAAAQPDAAALLAQQTVMLRRSWRFGGPIGKLAVAVNAGLANEARAVLRAREGDILSWQENARQAGLLQLALEGRPGAAGGYRHYLERVAAGPDGPADAAQDGAGDGFTRWVHAVLTAFDSFRLLCSVRTGEWGVEGVNRAVAQRLQAQGLIEGQGEWYVGRPVIVTRNDYAAGVFNGDIGIALRDPARSSSLRVYFLQGDGVRSVLASRLTNVESAYAMTVHKSQGSEFRHTVLVLPPQAGPVVVRELVYTGITRASEFFTLLSPVADVLDQALARQTRRSSGLRDFLHEYRPPPRS